MQSNEFEEKKRQRKTTTTTTTTTVELHLQANERLPFDLSEGKVGSHKGW